MPGNISGRNMAPNNVVATSRGTAILSFDNTSAFEQGALYEVNLATGATVPLQLGTQNTVSVINSTLLAASADGTKVYITPEGNIGFDGGAIDIWQAEIDGSTKELFYTGAIDQLATDDLGERLLGDSSTYDTSLRRLTTLAPDSTLVSSRNLVLGEQHHSSASLIYVPTTKGVEIYDVHTGAMVLSMAMQLDRSADPITLRSTMPATVSISPNRAESPLSICQPHHSLSAASLRHRVTPAAEQPSFCAAAVSSSGARSQSTANRPRSSSSIRPNFSSQLPPSPPPKTSSP